MSKAWNGTMAGGSTIKSLEGNMDKEWFTEGVKQVRCVVWDEDGVVIAKLCGSAEQRKKHGAMIAAMPDLLDALTDLVGGNGKEGNLLSSDAMDKAHAAIAKATNKEV